MLKAAIRKLMVKMGWQQGRVSQQKGSLDRIWSLQKITGLTDRATKSPSVFNLFFNASLCPPVSFVIIFWEKKKKCPAQVTKLTFQGRHI